jgi:hypothetical protein
MKATDLRIGNYYIGCSRQEIEVVSGKTIEQFESGVLPCMQPIPITEEWLVKFGFTYKSMGISGSICNRHSGHWCKDSKPYFAGSKKEFDIFLQFGEGVEIPHVHQLQNLYFALTGEELELT